MLTNITVAFKINIRCGGDQLKLSHLGHFVLILVSVIKARTTEGKFDLSLIKGKVTSEIRVIIGFENINNIENHQHFIIHNHALLGIPVKTVFYCQSGHQLATIKYPCFYITVGNWRRDCQTVSMISKSMYNSLN